MSATTGTELALATDDLAVETGWVLNNARLYATDSRMHRASQFCEAISPPVHRAQVGRWESGATSVSHAQVRQYEVVLGLPEGQLLAQIDLLAHQHQLLTAQPHLVPVRSPLWEDETDDLLDLARSTERMTAMQWRTLATNLGSVTTTFLRRDDWTHLLRRVSREAEYSTGLDYILRDEAKLALASHPRSTRAVLAMADEVLSDPVAPVYGETVSLLLSVPGTGPAELVLRHLADPVGEAAQFALMWLSRTMVTRSLLSPAHQEQMARHAVRVLDDRTSSYRLQRAAAAFLQLLARPERRRIVAGLQSETTRRRVARIIEHGGALADGQVQQLTGEIEGQLALTQRGDLHPVLVRLLRMASSHSAEDSRGTALSLLMLSPQGPVVGRTYARALRWALRNGSETVVDEGLSILSWLLPPEAVPWMMELAFRPATEPTRASQALVSVANARPSHAEAPDGHGPDEVVEMVCRSALAQMADPGRQPAVTTRGHLYVLGMYGRFDVITGLTEAASRPGVPPVWGDGIRSWLEVPTWARPLRV
ncbi:MAG: hypothetical protein M3Y71_11040 [Actinomycetota bacterium]|nr:hypothetical protein [Actinomycetota bacterium]